MKITNSKVKFYITRQAEENVVPYLPTVDEKAGNIGHDGWR